MKGANIIDRFATCRGLLAGEVLLCCWLLMAPAGAAEPVRSPVRAAFDATDTNHDRLLSFKEYLAGEGNPDIRRRDFHLFNIDGNGRLSGTEFAAIPGLVAAPKRGAIPDPFNHLFDAAQAAMQKSLKQAGQRDAAGVPAPTFVLLVLGTISPDGSQRMDDRWTAQADLDGDGRVNRMEAERFLEIHLGVRSPSGELLREPNGRVVALGRFQRIDTDRNQTLERDEFLQGRGDELSQQEFDAADRDRDGVLTFEEFGSPEGPGIDDPVEWFRNADENLDGLVGVAEAEQATEEARRALIPLSFRAFDEDEDGKLSLDEYRLSMLGNPVAMWEKVPEDADEDHLLSFGEFQFPAAQCELLRLYYFHRLDTNGDKLLTVQEFPFRAPPPNMFHLLAADGSEFRQLYANEEYPHCGSPAVSPDGKWIAFDGRRGGESLREQRILMTSIDGTDFRDVCKGLMPTWSKDGKQFACSRFKPKQGIWIIDADGSHARRIADGWAAQWSPDGRTIAFTNHNGVSAYDVQSGETREVLTAADHPYRTVYWNMCWSSDSRRLLFKARTDRGADLASIRMTGDDPDLKVHYSGDRSISEDSAWSPDGNRVVFCMESPEAGEQMLYEFDPTKDDPPKIVEGIGRSLTYRSGGCFTPDGKWLIVATKE